MDYEKKYKEALERAEKALEVFGTDKCEGARQIFSLFPELAESEDEKVRKAILELVRQSSEVLDKQNQNNMLVWLEKQGDQKSIIEMKTPEESLNIDSKTYNEIVNDCIFGENKPKFKVGDWISGYYTSYQVLSINNEGYVVEDVDGNKINILFENEKFHHLWTIKDAKDGDALSDGTTIFIFKDLLSDGSVMSCCDYDTDSGESDAFCPLSVNLMCSKITPTTKEQRDLLFQKMHEAGYMWDSESKQLLSLKAEPSDKQKPTWSEDDEKMCQETIDWFEKKCFPYALESENPARESIKWLKSLKEKL